MHIAGHQGLCATMKFADDEVECRIDTESEASLQRRRAVTRHRQMLAICCFAMIAAPFLHVRSDGRLAFRGLEEYPLPESCGSKILWKTNCPACGLTRSVTLCVQGDFAGSLAYHRLGWLMFAAIITQIPYRILSLRRPDAILVPKPIARAFGYILIATLIANWIIAMAQRSG